MEIVGVICIDNIESKHVMDMCHVKHLELLAPAKNLEQGEAAIAHGADAVYVGAPAFGARATAGNSLQDIEALVRYAHLYRAKVFAAVNTVLFDDELQEAATIIRALHGMGADALIVQDPGLLEMDLPPIELHASTQMHNLDPRRVAFLQQAGFRRIILPHELSIAQMRALHDACQANLEAFVQGALCVSYSGQCYMSQYITGNSGNRGRCNQPCRASYDLYNEQGKMLQHKRHLLSLKDLSAASHLKEMIEAGITSFKIEGRLKDLSYVKNTTAYYRQLIDRITEEKNISRKEDEEIWQRASSGRCRFYFVPDPERTFNRTFTDYFLTARQPMATLTTAKAIGKKIGTVARKGRDTITLYTTETLTPGDGLCFFNNVGELEGLQVNHATGNTFTPNHLPETAPGTAMWRSNDFAFEKQLQGKTAERKIAVDMELNETPEGLVLRMTDEDDVTVAVETACRKDEARNADKAREQLQRQLQKLGDTAFVPRQLRLPARVPFLPASRINELRREAVEKLTKKRTETFRPSDVHTHRNDAAYPCDTLDYRANVSNAKAEQFYKRHGIKKLEYGLEYSDRVLATSPECESTKKKRRAALYDGKALMTTKYCLRYELGQCLRHKNNAEVGPDYQGTLILRNNKRLFRLTFNCQRCEMQILPYPANADEFIANAAGR